MLMDTRALFLSAVTLAASSISNSVISQEIISIVNSSLPEGAGLASGYVVDKGIKEAPSVIFSEDFESEQYKKNWDEIRDNDEKVLSLVGPDETNGIGQCLKVTAKLGKNTGGGLTKWFESADTLFIRFYTRFAPESDYIHHFVTLRANKGLTGNDRWSGFGGAGLKPEGGERFSTALEPWGNWGKWQAPGRWNFYSYWHEMKASGDGNYWGNSFRPDSQPNIRKGEWICAEFMLKHNTPDNADGEQAFWINGELRGHWKGFQWRTSANLRANALTLESYVTDRWTNNPTNIIYFDNLVIANRYIGPMNR